jgi:hypothetical protein
MGAQLKACLIEAIAVCATERIDVSLIHNDREYQVDFQNLVDCVTSKEPEP